MIAYIGNNYLVNVLFIMYLDQQIKSSWRQKHQSRSEKDARFVDDKQPHATPKLDWDASKAVLLKTEVS